jgi:hypothetical protein
MLSFELLSFEKSIFIGLFSPALKNVFPYSKEVFISSS